MIELIIFPTGNLPVTCATGILRYFRRIPVLIFGSIFCASGTPVPRTHPSRFSLRPFSDLRPCDHHLSARKIVRLNTIISYPFPPVHRYGTQVGGNTGPCTRADPRPFFGGLKLLNPLYFSGCDF